MSLILDALRKIEQERKTRRQGSGDIRSDVLTYRAGTPTPTRSRLFPLLGLGLMVIVATAALFLRGKSSPLAPLTEERAFATSRLQPAARQAPTALPPPATLQPPPAAPATPAMAPAMSKPAAKQVPLPVPTASQAENNVTGEGSDLLVSGIAWQEERGLRRAVVNGSLVGEGAEILGARVVEIRENRVRFSRGGSSFDVHYGGAGR